MKTTVGALKAALAKVQKAVHSSLVTLQGVGPSLTIHASNGPQGSAKATLVVQDATEFTAQIDGNRLSAVLGGADASLPCQIKVTKDDVRIKFGHANIRLQIAQEEASLLEESRWNGATPIGERFSGADLKAAFERVAPFAARHDVRYYLTGVLMTTRDNRLTLVGTDGFRLACFKTGLAVTAVPDSIIPIQIAEALSSVLESSSLVEICTVGSDESRGIGFRTETFEVMCPVIAGKYPNFDRVIPDAETMNRADVDRKAALAVLERIAAVADAKGGACFINVAIKAKQFIALTTDEESKDHIELEEPVSVAMELGFQPKLLIPALAAVKTEKACFLYTPSKGTDTGKVLIRDAEGSDWSVVVMPSRT